MSENHLPFERQRTTYCCESRCKPTSDSSHPGKRSNSPVSSWDWLFFFPFLKADPGQVLTDGLCFSQTMQNISAEHNTWKQAPSEVSL